MEIDWVKRQLEELGEAPDDETADISPAPQPVNLTQHTLLSYLANNADAWAIVQPIIRAEYFDEEYKKVVQHLLDHTLEYKQVPSLPMIRMKTGVLLEVPEDAKDDRTTQWLLDEIQTFCRHRATEIEIKRAALSIQQDSSRGTIEQIFQNFKKITEISLEKDLGIEIHRDARTTLEIKDEEIIKPTGYRHLDQVVSGGFPCPGMVLVAGRSGLGKSVTLANFGVQYCTQGDFVVYITLELPERRVFERVCSMMVDVPIKGIHANRDFISNTMEYRIESEGLFRIKKMKMSGTTTAHIHAYLKELYLKEGKKPKVLILDYLDLLYPRANLRDLSNIHIKDKYTTEETYALCDEWDILCITASQMVKNNQELDPFDHAGVGGGTPKINTVDYALALERKDDDFWMRLLKGRYGGEGSQIPFHWNYNTLKISDGPEELFLEKNPRFNPQYKRETAEKTAMQLRTELNKDVRRVHNDEILDRIKSMNASFMDEGFGS